MATFSLWLIALALMCSTPGLSTAADDAEGIEDRDRSYEDRIDELERTVGVLAMELERTRRETVVPESPDLKSPQRTHSGWFMDSRATGSTVRAATGREVWATDSWLGF